MHKENTKIWSLYRITCLINNKVYIGQSVDPSSRWRAHRRDSADPKVPFHHAIKKYGSHNFEFKIIASCKSKDAANELETLLVSQYDSFISNGKGYNATHGGDNAPKSEAWKQGMRDWHASMSPEYRNELNQKLSISFTKYIKENGHIALGTKRTQEQKDNMSSVQQSMDRTNMYTEEVRERISKAHIGIVDSEETKQKKAESARLAWDKRIDYSRKCEAPGCDVAGKSAYKIINNVRYCNKHGLRMLRYGRLDRLIPA